MASPKASGRMINRSISESEKFASLSPVAAVLFVMLIPHFNAHGKMQGGPGVVKDEVVPMIPYLTYDNIPGYLQEISDKTNVKWFRQGSKWWLHSLNFNSKHQRLKEDRMGSDDLPDYHSCTTPEVVQDYSGSSAGVVQEIPSAREGFKVLREEEKQQQQHARKKWNSSLLFEACFNEHGPDIRRLYPHASFEVEKETCIAYYRERPPPVDPWPVVLKWFNRIAKPGDGDGKPSKARASPKYGGRDEEIRARNERLMAEFDGGAADGRGG